MIDTLGDILRNNALKFPDEIAFVYEGSRVTYSHQLNRANRLASALWKSGIRRQDRVSILSQNTLEFMETYAACELAGFIAAHAIWCVSDAESFTPMFAFTTEDGQRELERLDHRR